MGQAQESLKFVRASNEGQMVDNNKGLLLPSIGTIRAIWVVCKFCSDTFDSSPFTDRWPSSMDTPETFPTWTSSLLAPGGNPSYTLESMSEWYREMSLGNLNVIGDVFKYVPSYPESYYFRNTSYLAGDDRRRGLAYLNAEAIKAVDSIYNIDFSLYDNWKKEHGLWVNSPDGKVDLVIITYRFFDAPNLAGYAFSGVGLLDPNFGADGFFPVRLDGKTIEYNLGVTNEVHAPEGGIQTTAHEIGHLLFGHFHHGGIGLNLAGFNAYERWLMGWINPRHADTNQSVADLNDFITTGDAIRISTPDPTEFFLVENHQKLNAYENFPRWHGGPPQFGGDPGLYIFHVDEKIPQSGESRRMFVELASGRYDWRKTTYQRSKYYNFPFEIIRPNIAYGVTSINLPFKVYDTHSDTIRTLSDPEGAAAGIHGNQYDTFHEGFKTEFSYATNPATNLSGGNQNGSTLTSIALRNIRRIPGTNLMAFELQLTPPAPAVVSPASGATGLQTSPSLMWSTSPGATSYRLQVSSDTSFSPTVLDQGGITRTSYAVSGLANNTTYHWRVNASNAAGPGDWSSAWSFTTTPLPPSAPRLHSP